MEGHSGGPPKEANRHISAIPPAANLPKRRMPESQIELPPKMRMTFGHLISTMKERRYPSLSLAYARKAYTLADAVHEGEMRDDGKGPYIAHPLTVAIRAARLKLEAEAVCASLLHDTIEDAKHDFPVNSKTLERLFGDSDEALKFGKKVAEIVVFLTKPLLNDSKKWIFADDPSFNALAADYKRALAAATNRETDEIKKLYGTHKSMYDLRSAAYYNDLLNSRNLDAIVIKILDNLHNAETLAGIKVDKREKNVDTMVNNTLLLAELFFTPADVAYLKKRIEAWGFELPPLIKRPQPQDMIVLIKRRDSLDQEALLSHPNPESAFISVYGTDIDAFVSDYIEIGLPPHLSINYRSVLEKYLPEGLFCALNKSLMPDTIPTHEIIFRIHGFNLGDLSLLDKPLRRIRFSAQVKDFVEVLDEKGELVIGLPTDAFSATNVYFGKGLHERFMEARQRYQDLMAGLRRLYDDEVRPALERQTAPPDSPHPGK